MNKNKSKSSYTNKWLNRNLNAWYEKPYKCTTVIILKKKDAPKIVVEQIAKINDARIKKHCNENVQKTKKRIFKSFVDAVLKIPK